LADYSQLQRSLDHLQRQNTQLQKQLEVKTAEGSRLNDNLISTKVSQICQGPLLTSNVLMIKSTDLNIVECD